MELQHLRKIAEKLDVIVGRTLGADKLETKLKAYCKENNIDFNKIAEEAIKESENEIDYSKINLSELDKQHSEEKTNQQLKDSMKLIRCIITCNDPNKSKYEGEIFCVKNAVLPEIKKFVSFNVPTHVPQMLLNMIREKKCQLFTEKRVNGNTVTDTRLIDEYNIQILPPLTPDELEAIKKKQLAEGYNNE